MRCPFCDKDNDKVLDSRTTDGGSVIRRRRQCVICTKRFTTYERVDQTARLVVIKRDGRREAFDRSKVMRSVQIACGKRRIPQETLEQLVDQVEEELQREFEREVNARVVGERVMRRLFALDEVACIRFASEYYAFKSIDDLRRQMDEMKDHVPDSKDQHKLFA